jgi:hypothetical protein
MGKQYSRETRSYTFVDFIRTFDALEYADSASQSVLEEWMPVLDALENFVTAPSQIAVFQNFRFRCEIHLALLVSRNQPIDDPVAARARFSRAYVKIKNLIMNNSVLAEHFGMLSAHPDACKFWHDGKVKHCTVHF